MQILIILVLALTTVANETYKFNDERIINGVPAAVGQVPYQAGLFTNLGFFCGCAIYKNCCLTAAHCLEHVTSGRVIYGTTNVYSNRLYQNFTASDIFIHSSWDRQTLKGDIGIVKLKKKLPNTPLIRSVKLACSNSTCRANDAITVCGWGKTSDNSSIARYLQCADLLIVSKQNCERTFGVTLSYGQLCVGNLNNSSACNGDSGSAGVMTSTRNHCGLVSFGSGRSCQRGAPNVFTRTAAYCPWIKQFCN